MNKPHGWAALLFGEATLEVATTRSAANTATIAQQATEPLAEVTEAGDRLQITARTLKQRIDLRDHRIITAVPCEEVFCQTLRLPATDAGELQQMLDLQIDSLTPLPLEEIVYIFEALEATATETRVLVAVARKAAVNERVAALEAVGWPAEVVSIDALAVFRQLARQGVLPADAKLNTLILVGPTAANLIVYSAGKLISLRSVMVGIAGELDRVALREEWQRTLVAAEVEHSVHETGVTQLVTWSDAVRPQLAELAQSWGPGVEFLANGSSPQPAPSVCLDAALAVTAQINLLPAEWRERRRKQRVKTLAIRGGIALGIIYVLTLVTFLTLMGIKQAQLSKVQGQIRKLQPEFQKARELNRTLVAMEKQLDTKFSVLEVLREVSQTLPENVKLNGFKFRKDENISISAQAQSAGVATDFISRLEKSEMFAKVTPGNMRSDAATGLTKFDVTCTLKSAEAGYGNK